MKEVNDFKYLYSILCKHGSMEREVREQALQGRKVIGPLGRTANMEIKRHCVVALYSAYTNVCE